MSQQQVALHSHHRVLLIEDNPADAELIQWAIAKADPPYPVHHVTRLNEGVSCVHEGEYSVVLSDLSLPDSYGLDTVRALRRHAPSLPIVVLTSHASDETALKALDEGAQDFLVKDNVTTEMLQRAIRYAAQRQKNSEMRRLIDTLRDHEQQLEKNNRRLEKLYKTAHDFVDNVSHEFRTPLTVIKEYVSLVRDGVVGQLNEEQARMLDVVGDRADDLNNMVDDMLDISKLEAGMLGIWRKDCDVAKIIDHIRPNLQKKSSIKDVEITFDVPADLPQVYCDDEKVGRVIVNLATNAIKFSGDPGNVRVWVTQNLSGHEVVIGVTDNGPGISEANLQAVFERFKQVGDNPRGSTKGFGLGLNIAKELVDLNLGEIQVESERGNGSTFSFTVPFADPVEVVRRYVSKVQQLHNGSSVASLVRVQVTYTPDGASPEDTHSFLNSILRRDDLLFPVDQGEWLIVLPLSKTGIPKVIDRIEKMRNEANENRPLGALPDFTIERVGSWRLDEDTSALLTQVKLATELSEVAHV